MIKNFKNLQINLASLNLLRDAFTPAAVRQAADMSTIKQTILQRDIEKVKNVDESLIKLVIKSGEENIEPIGGFLVEVYSSGSDGKLVRMLSEDLVDLNGNVVEQGFSDYLVMEIDNED